MTVRIVLSLFIVLSACICRAQTVIVSDIDDTIKISHVRSLFGQVTRAFETSSSFTGMPQLYSLIKAQTNGEIYYLSNGPEWLMRKSHAAFLERNHYPQGTLLLRTFPKETNKLIHLRRIIAEKNPTMMILIGDNGEHDIDVYDQIRREYPAIKFHQFIRTIYSPQNTSGLSKLKDGQRSFAIPGEIALALADEKVVSDDLAKQMAEWNAKAFTGVPRSNRYGSRPHTRWTKYSEYVWSLEPDDMEIPGFEEYRAALGARVTCDRIFNP